MVKILRGCEKLTREVGKLPKGYNESLLNKLWVDHVSGTVNSANFITPARKLRSYGLLLNDSWILSEKGELVIELLNLTMGEK